MVRHGERAVARRRLSQAVKEVKEKEKQFRREDLRSEITDHVERDAWGKSQMYELRRDKMRSRHSLAPKEKDSCHVTQHGPRIGGSPRNAE